MNEKVAVEVLKLIKEILDKHDVEYWLDEGTLLGAVRDRKFIPWDHDIDLAMFYKNISGIIPLFDGICNIGVEVCFFEWKKHIKLLGVGYEIDINLYLLNDGKATKRWYEHNNVGRVLDYFIWIFYLQNANIRKSDAPLFITRTLIRIKNMLPNRINKKILEFLVRIYYKDGCKVVNVIVPCHFFEKLSTIEFYGMKFKVPSPVEDYLEYRYGKDWKIPKQDYIYYKDDGAVKRN